MHVYRNTSCFVNDLNIDEFPSPITTVEMCYKSVVKAATLKIYRVVE